jgi:hypothetical protein
MSLAELKMQPTLHFQSESGYFKYHIVLKWNHESMILFVTTDI